MNSEFGRTNPSPRYRQLIEMYRNLHAHGEPELGRAPEHTVDGRSLLPYGGQIKALIDAHDARTLLDYGSGKGRQYGPFQITMDDGVQYSSIPEFWNLTNIVCYDPAHDPIDRLPDGPFDGVICTDVLEHCPEEDLRWITDELFSMAGKFVFCTVALYPAQKSLPNGENAHCTLKSAAWWQSLVASVAVRHASIRYRFLLQRSAPGPDNSAPSDTVVVAG